MSIRPVLVPAALFAALLCAAGTARAGSCVDETRVEETRAQAEAGPPPNPRGTLQALVKQALDHSQAIGAARLLAEAAVFDVEEQRAAKAPQAGMTAGIGPGGARSQSVSETSTLQLRTSFNISQLLYDGGRTDRLTGWRERLAEAARLGHLTAREQIALSTVSLALDRARYRQHVVIYGQYTRKMGCLVEALESIVRADRGRASEWVQAKKTLQQAELLYANAQSSARQADVRLRRLVGDGLPGTEGMSTVLLDLEPLPQLLAEVDRSTEIAQFTAQVQAADEYARAVAAGNKPQVSWAIGGVGTAGAGGNAGNTRTSNYSLGVTVNIPIYTPGYAPATSAARRRAEAAEMQRNDALEGRRFRVAEVYEQTLASFDRAKRVSSVLKDSDQLRNFTLQQWQQLGRRSLFDVMSTEAEHYSLRAAYVDSLSEGQQFNALLLSLGRGVGEWLK